MSPLAFAVSRAPIQNHLGQRRWVTICRVQVLGDQTTVHNCHGPWHLWSKTRASDRHNLLQAPHWSAGAGQRPPDERLAPTTHPNPLAAPRQATPSTTDRGPPSAVSSAREGLHRQPTHTTANPTMADAVTAVDVAGSVGVTGGL